MNKSVLIIGLIWPEPDATAAGTRMMQLIGFFLDQNYKVYFASAASENELSYDLKALGVHCFSIKLNHSSFNIKVADLDPEIVLFDRFLSEEQFGWRVHEACPDAIRILDTEDLHFLRKSRELALKNEDELWRNYLNNDITKREIASIYRSDLSLIISEFEYSLLKENYKIDDRLILHLPFIDASYAKINLKQYPSFTERNNFMTLGNFKHRPNQDAVKYLRKAIWPYIRKKLPKSEMHVFGAYLPESIKQLENKKIGFFVKGWIPKKQEAYTSYRVCLAPLRFGAGQKGKLLDAMQFGTPSITSGIGAEGMADQNTWNGFITNNISEFVEKAVLLYSDELIWKDSQKKGIKILQDKFDKVIFENSFLAKLKELKIGLESHRQTNFIGSMLMHHSLQSTKYFSKWIALKNLSDDEIV